MRYTNTSAVGVVDPERIEKNGVVYTKPWAVELILDLAGYRAEADLVGAVAVEPAAGVGAFLVPMVRRLLASCRRQRRPFTACADSLLAYELDLVSAERARREVLGVLLDYGAPQEQAEELVRTWIRVGDYLLDAPILPRADFVIGNPPYVRLEEMDGAMAARYRRLYPAMVGRADLYVAFFEAALKGLKPDGVCAYICADRWMRNQYGAELRRLVTAGYGVETVIEMHQADAFESEVSAYPAITVIRRGRQRQAVVARAALSLDGAGSETLARLLHSLLGGDAAPPSAPNGVAAATVDTWFQGADPWPCVSPARLILLKRLEAEFYPLESIGTATKVSIGVATGADEVFVTTDPDIVEPSRLLPLAMAHDLLGGQVQWSGHYLIDPWGKLGLVDLDQYPRLRSYFEAHQDQLKQRHIGKRRPREWYRTIDRVHHALTGKPKLYIADIKDRLNPVLDRGQTYPHHNLYFVHSAAWDHELLGGRGTVLRRMLRGTDAGRLPAFPGAVPAPHPPAAPARSDG